MSSVKHVVHGGPTQDRIPLVLYSHCTKTSFLGCLRVSASAQPQKKLVPNLSSGHFLRKPRFILLRHTQSPVGTLVGSSTLQVPRCPGRCPAGCMGPGASAGWLCFASASREGVYRAPALVRLTPYKPASVQYRDIWLRAMSGEIHHWEDDTVLLPLRRRTLYEKVQKARVATKGHQRSVKNPLNIRLRCTCKKTILNCIPLTLYNLAHQLKPEE